jgi:hypothetical protein
MKRRLRREIRQREYRIDPDAVAFAILRRGIHFAPVPVMPSEVLVPAEMFEDDAGGPDKLRVLALSDGS